MKTTEIIQQLQYIGKLDEKLLSDDTFVKLKKAGVNSVQSYVTWAEVESEEGHYDFSSYETLVNQLKKHQLNWVPFLILGPHYATPNWFQQSSKNLYATCLEHNQTSKIQSIWNPHLPDAVDHFLQIFADHFKHCQVISSILLGISGNWGESIYPDSGCFYGNFHTHAGWWCGDSYARQQFQNNMLKKYASLENLNNTWNTHFKNITEITFPYEVLPKNKPQTLRVIANNIYEKSPRQFKQYAVKLNKFYTTWQVSQLCKSIPNQIKNSSTHLEDFVAWYLDAMSQWSEFWLKKSRAYFPKVDLYLVSGGNGLPHHGADFSKQVKIASQYNAGIRITNQTDDFSQSFTRTCLISSASRFYQTYFSTEEARVNSDFGVTMRLFEGLSSGAKSIYCKGILGLGEAHCSHVIQPSGELTLAADNLKKYYPLIQSPAKPIINVAIIYPNRSIIYNARIQEILFHYSSQLRKHINFDFIDENMINESAADNYRFIINLVGMPSNKNIDMLRQWLTKGNVLLSQYNLLAEPIDYSTLKEPLLLQGNGYSYTFKTTGNKYIRQLVEALTNKNNQYPWPASEHVFKSKEGIYVSELPQRTLYFDETRHRIWSEPVKE